MEPQTRPNDRSGTNPDTSTTRIEDTVVESDTFLKNKTKKNKNKNKIHENIRHVAEERGKGEKKGGGISTHNITTYLFRIIG